MTYITKLRTCFILVAFLLPGRLNAEGKVGVILPMTGDFARYGEKIRVGLESGKPPNVRYVYEDEGCEPRKAVSSYQKLSAVDGIRVFLGSWCGSPQLAAEVLMHGLEKCPELSSECLQHEVRSAYTFDEHGVMQGDIGLKIVKDGKFVWFER
jgi:hypothetical protein